MYVYSIKKNYIIFIDLRFLSMLEEEVYSNSSPIWDADFRPQLPPHLHAQATERASGKFSSSGDKLPHSFTLHLSRLHPSCIQISLLSTWISDKLPAIPTHTAALRD